MAEPRRSQNAQIFEIAGDEVFQVVDANDTVLLGVAADGTVSAPGLDTGAAVTASGAAAGSITKVSGGDYTDGTLAARYTRVGDIVTVTGKFTTDTTNTGVSQLSFYIPLPVASNFTANSDAAGIANALNGTSIFGVGSITADGTADKAVLFLQLSAAPGNGQTISVFLSFSYTVK